MQGSGSHSLYHIQSFPVCWWFCTQTGSHMTANDSLFYGPPHNVHISLKAKINTDSHLFACLSASLLPSWSHCSGAPRKQIMFLFDVSLVASTIPDMWSVQFSQSVLSNSCRPIIPSKEIPGLISFRMDWFDLLAVQGTLKSLLQHHSYS